MFQTEIVKYVQSFETPFLNYFFQFITTLGYDYFFFIVILSIMWGIDFKKGFLLSQIVILTAFITDFFKISFAMPRPYDVDSNVKLFDSFKENSAPFTNMGGKSFFSFLPPEVIEYYKVNTPKSFGLPSGHTSSAVAMWGSLIILFNSRAVKIVCITFLLLVPFSRIYLGKHFIGDILGGYLLGLIILLVFYLMFFKEEKLRSFLNLTKLVVHNSIKHVFLIAYFLILPVVLFLVVPYYYIELTGTLFGLNLSFIIISINGFPVFNQSIKAVILRIVIAFAAFLLSGFLFGGLFKLIGGDSIYYLHAFERALFTTTAILATHYVSIKLKLVEIRGTTFEESM